jgi:hypothetical protein
MDDGCFSKSTQNQPRIGTGRVLRIDARAKTDYTILARPGAPPRSRSLFCAFPESYTVRGSKS